MTSAPIREKAIQLVLLSTSLTQEQRDSYVTALREGSITPELEATLVTLFRGEAKLLDNEIAACKEALMTQQARMKEYKSEQTQEEGALVATYSATLDQAVAGCQTECNRIERDAFAFAEGSIKTQEDAEADAIRAMLKNKA